MIHRTWCDCVVYVIPLAEGVSMSKNLQCSAVVVAAAAAAATVSNRASLLVRETERPDGGKRRHGGGYCFGNGRGKVESEMAGDSTTNNEIGEGVEQGASVRGERHSRVGGILECDPPGNRNSLSMSDQANENTDDDEDGVCRYGVNPANSGMSFIEVCQIRLQNFFPHLAPPSSRYGICDDNVELTAEILAHDVIRYLLKEDMYLISRDSISRSMRHNVYQMLNKHSILFTSMVNRLNVVPDTAYEAFTGVADELFLHGEITWAKIVCLYAFMGRLALWARDGRMHALKQKLPLYVSRYIGEAIAHFIKGYGGWEQLCIEYPVAEEVSGAVWRSLLMTGATLSLVATILTVTA